jgi:hypothetical protein
MIYKFILANLPRIILGLAIAVALAIAYFTVTGRWRAEADLAKRQAESATASGKDAVNTVGEAAARESTGADLDRSNEKEIRNADGASEVVRPGVRDAGLDSLCRRAAYKRDARCLQRAHP